jgi:hypothetical protein
MNELLYLTHRIPYPPNKGDKIRSFNILKYLSQHFRVHLGSFVDDPDDWRYRDDGSRKLRDHWAEHPELVEDHSADGIEQAYLIPPVPRADLLVIDGAMRQRTIVQLLPWARDCECSLIVVDNTENSGVARAVESVDMNNYHRLDFRAANDGIVADDREYVQTSIFCHESIAKDIRRWEPFN